LSGFSTNVAKKKIAALRKISSQGGDGAKIARRQSAAHPPGIKYFRTFRDISIRAAIGITADFPSAGRRLSRPRGTAFFP
jgi:hypothetical protein